MQVSIKLYNKTLYYPGESLDNPIYVHITVANKSDETLRFKLADDRMFSIDFTAFNSKNKKLPYTEEIIKKLGVVTPSAETPVRRLSGGNVQKVLVGREIAASPTVLMAAYPVRGLDINSSYTIYDLLTKQKETGVSVIFVGEDLDVLLELCDRILVLCAGKVSGIIPGKGAQKHEVGMMMTRLGGNSDE